MPYPEDRSDKRPPPEQSDYSQPSLRPNSPTQPSISKLPREPEQELQKTPKPPKSSTIAEIPGTSEPSQRTPTNKNEDPKGKTPTRGKRPKKTSPHHSPAKKMAESTPENIKQILRRGQLTVPENSFGYQPIPGYKNTFAKLFDGTSGVVEDTREAPGDNNTGKNPKPEGHLPSTSSSKKYPVVVPKTLPGCSYYSSYPAGVYRKPSLFNPFTRPSCTYGTLDGITFSLTNPMLFKKLTTSNPPSSANTSDSQQPEGYPSSRGDVRPPRKNPNPGKTRRDPKDK